MAQWLPVQEPGLCDHCVPGLQGDGGADHQVRGDSQEDGGSQGYDAGQPGGEGDGEEQWAGVSSV